MSGIRGRNKKPELTVRHWLHRRGFRFRIHVKGLPGSPDVVLPRHRSVVFVHGCFWHRHPGCRYAYHPASNKEFWGKKFDSNVRRDEENAAALSAAGWYVLTIWECEI